jgi:hypothetical protein
MSQCTPSTTIIKKTLNKILLKTQKNLRNCNNQEQPKEILCFNATWYLKWDTSIKKKTSGKNSPNLEKVGRPQRKV